MKIKAILISCLLGLIIYGCKKSNESSISISGKWFQINDKWDDNYALKETFDFKSDNTIEITGTAIDKKTNEVKGYAFKRTGNVSFKKDSLIISNVEVYGTGEHSFKPLSELKYITSYKRDAYKPVYSNNNTTLILLFTCPPNADCIPVPKLTKEN